MRIVNIVRVKSGIPMNIDSFPILEEQLSEDVVNEVEELFIEMVEKFVPNLSDEDRDAYLEDGFFSDEIGNEIYIIWSDSVNE
jgi:hypothetical protein